MQAVLRDVLAPAIEKAFMHPQGARHIPNHDTRLKRLLNEPHLILCTVLPTPWLPRQALNSLVSHIVCVSFATSLQHDNANLKAQPQIRTTALTRALRTT